MYTLINTCKIMALYATNVVTFFVTYIRIDHVLIQGKWPTINNFTFNICVYV